MLSADANRAPLLASLNDMQHAAVTAPPGNMLVLAGAGSGKTRVLTCRFAHLVQSEGCSPYSIMALTFTNRAANEMRGRIEKLIERSLRGLWVGTFHSIALRLLRMHTKEAKLPDDFQILNADDQRRLIKREMKSLNLDPASWVPKDAANFINAQKESGLRAANVVSDGFPTDIYIDIYLAYEEACNRGGLVDFTEMLLRSHELLKENPDLLADYRARFTNLLVDEFQDTNNLQYQWLQLLAGDSGRVTAVGDDDQSIYGWRGARIENIQGFKDDFSDVTLIRLEQNYRSTGNILETANFLISSNEGRIGKRLWTQAPSGLPIRCYAADDEKDEANFVLDQVLDWQSAGNKLSQAAVLYRSNAQSRAFEEACLGRQLPYVVYGGMPFYDRAEVKNALAYMKLIVNPEADEAFERVVNFPPRGIGQKTLEGVRTHAKSQNISLWQSCRDMVASGQLSSRGAGALELFCQLIVALQEETTNLPLHEIVDLVIVRSGLKEYHSKEKGEIGLARVENLEELVSACQGYVAPSGSDFGDPDAEQQDEVVSTLRVFLDQIALDTGDTRAGPDQDALRLMTLHSSKGLEFPLVFMVGMEAGLFPHHQSIGQQSKLEEERRLCYVGITRAMEELYFIHAETRQLHGETRYNLPSSFLKEMPKALLEHVRPSTAGLYSQPSVSVSSEPEAAENEAHNADIPQPGQRVGHEIFGTGVVLSVQGSGPKAKVQVNFDKRGRKLLMLAYANLELYF